MTIQMREKNGKTQYRWGNTGTWYSTETQAHDQGLKLQAEQKRRLYLQKKKNIGKKVVSTQLRKRKMLEQAGQ